MGLVGADLEMGFFQRNILELEAGQFTDPESGLEQQLDDAVHADVVFDTVAERAVLEGGENTGRGDLVFRVGDRGGGTCGHDTFGDQVLEE